MSSVIINQISGNIGDEAAGNAAIYQLQDMFPGESIVVTYRKTSQGSERIRGTFADRCEHDLTSCLSREDVVFILRSFLLYRGLRSIPKNLTGTRALIQHFSAAKRVVVAPSGANIGSYGDTTYLSAVLLAIQLKHKPIFHLNTIGSSGKFWFDAIAQSALRKSCVFVRESKSAEYLEKKRIVHALGVDSAFALPDRQDSSERQEQHLAFIPTLLGNWHPRFRPSELREAMCEHVVPTVGSYAKEQNLLVRLVPHYLGEPRSDESIQLASEVLQKLGVDCCVASEIRSYADYEDEILAARLAVTMRYHGLIFAIKNAVPCVALNYDTKMDDAAEYGGVSELSFDLSQLTSDKLEHAIRLADHDRVRWSEEMKLRRSMLCRLARLPVDYLRRCGEVPR